MRLLDTYQIIYGEKTIGYYYTYDNNTVSYHYTFGKPCDIEEELKALGLDKSLEEQKEIPVLAALFREEHRVPGKRRAIYQDGTLTAERDPRETSELFYVYRRNAEEGEPDYSPLPHDAPHYEGPHTPEGMREWASWYAFRKMDDGTFQAELDEAWWWGGGHNDGGTIRRLIPEEWQSLPYEEFLEHVVTLAAAAHYGFTAEELLKRDGLREFFGF